MWIVRLALRRPWSFTVMAILIVLVGIVTIARMSTDIFPDINIPVVSMIWSYPGVAPEVKFLLVDENAPIVVPANTFLFRAQGPQVATITKENRIHGRQFRSVAISATQIEVTGGLAENAKVVMNPTDDLREGIQVQVKPSQKPEGQDRAASSERD
jgi:hypothetical protein